MGTPSNSPEAGLISTAYSFEGRDIRVLSAPLGQLLDVRPLVQEPDGFVERADPHVHDAVYFGKIFAGLIGEHQDPDGFFADRDALPAKGVVVLADHIAEARRTVADIDGLAQKVIEDARLYRDLDFCTEYLELARHGYGLLSKHLRDFDLDIWGTPVSLERAGLVTTRLAHQRGLDEIIEKEIRVVTKRAHPVGGQAEDLMVTVQLRDHADIAKIHGATLDITDFVNPASGASTAAMLAAARARGGTAKEVIHRSIMATEQGIEFTRRLLGSTAMGAMGSLFVTLGTSRTLTDRYYLANPAVADAGDILQHFLPSWYER